VWLFLIQIPPEKLPIITATTTALAALFAFFTIVVMQISAKEAETQQLNITRSTVMSQCMAEYFTIRRETADKFQTNSTNSGTVQEIYSERMYGLHFEEYHLFELNMISEHVYAIWLKNLRDDYLPITNSRLPTINFDKYISRMSDPDFDRFIQKVLALKNTNILGQIKVLLNKENRNVTKDPLDK
jgi:hypothetical protein